MARPFKQGLSYFPFDVNFFRDPRIRKLKNRYGYLGTQVYICILTLVYGQGYFLEGSKEDLSELVYEELRGPTLRNVDRITEVIDLLTKCELLDNSLMSSNVISSMAIQKQWLTSVARRKKIDKSKYRLLSENDEASIKNFNESCVASAYPNNIVDSNNVVNVENNPVNDDKSTQKENKKKRDHDKKINIDKRAFGMPKLHFITQALIKNKYLEENDLMIGNFNILFEKLVKAYGFDMVLSVSDYIIKCSKREHIEIENRFEYFKVSAEVNLKLLETRNERGSYDIRKEIDTLIKTMGEKG